jgi:predicted PurR-regulated permease PerM
MGEPRTTDQSVLAPHVDPTADAAPAAPGAAEPDLTKTSEAITSRQARSAATTVIAVLLVLYTLYFARTLLMPIVFAVLLNFLFSPAVRALARARIPTPLGAALVIFFLFGAVGVSAYELAGPAQRWIASAPESFANATTRLRALLRPVERVTRTAATVARAADSTNTNAPRVVVREGPSFESRAFGTTQRFLAAVLEVVILLYFLLAAGDLFIQKLIKVLPHLREKRAAVQIARETETAISTYLLTAALVNVVEGTVVAIAMYLLGMPNPELWGALVAVFEFIPYLGATALVAILTVAGLSVFGNLGHALLPPAVYLAINLVQANFVTPLLLGERLALNPVAILVGLAFWFYVWGVVGAFLAVPLLATFKIFCDHIDSLASVGEFLSGRDEGERRAVVREVTG